MRRFLSLGLICLVSMMGCSGESAEVNRSAEKLATTKPAANQTPDAPGESTVDEPITFDVYTDFI